MNKVTDNTEKRVFAGEKYEISGLYKNFLLNIHFSIVKRIAFKHQTFNSVSELFQTS